MARTKQTPRGADCSYPASPRARRILEHVELGHNLSHSATSAAGLAPGWLHSLVVG